MSIIFTFYLWFSKLKIPVLFLRIKGIGIINEFGRMSHSLPQWYDSLASILIPLKGVDIIPKGQNSFFSRLRPLSKLVTLLLSTREKENGLLVSLTERKN